MTPLRLGEIQFINALPLALPENALGVQPVETFRAAPTELNRAMQVGALDLSPVSSAFYLRHPERFVLLENIAISAEQPVESVLLFLPNGLEGFSTNEAIAVPNTSETSVALMQYAIYRKTGVKPRNPLSVYPIGQGEALLHQGMPLLAIGDEALTLASRFPKEQVMSLDLAQVWQEETELPFVFAVWIAKKSWAEANPEQLSTINRLLVAQKQTFQTDSQSRAAIIAEAHQRCPQLPLPLLEHYFTTALSYNLEQRHRLALSWFQRILTWLDNDRIQPHNGDCPKLPVELLHR